MVCLPLPRAPFTLWCDHGNTHSPQNTFEGHLMELHIQLCVGLGCEC
jgi:hypothetical protein